jgi:uroporphyrin-3 C-methyltransferase
MPNKKTSENQMTDSKSPSAKEQTSSTKAESKQEPKNSTSNATDVVSSKASSESERIKKAVANKKAEKANQDNQATADDKTVKGKTGSKLSIAALIIACASILASGGHYVWQQQQTSLLEQNLNQQNQEAITTSEKQTKQALIGEFKKQLQLQQQAFSADLQHLAKQSQSINQDKIEQLNLQISHLEQRIAQRQPSDWLVHEAEYLVRVAARTMWLEKDTTAAIGLLKDADNRLGELNNPKFLPVRALLHQDIKSLELMPTLENQQAVLSLMALNKQVSALPLAGVDLANALDTQENLELTSDINDWQANLKKTWQKFLNDFITVRRRSGMVEPLMSPEQQQNLKQNLSLKIQLASWAASEQMPKIYQQALVDIQQWLTEFYDMQAIENQNFLKAIEQLNSHTIHYAYPSDLASLSAISALTNEKAKTIASKPVEKAESTQTEQNKDSNQELPEGNL